MIYVSQKYSITDQTQHRTILFRRRKFLVRLPSIWLSLLNAFFAMLISAFISLKYLPLLLIRSPRQTNSFTFIISSVPILNYICSLLSFVNFMTSGFNALIFSPYFKPMQFIQSIIFSIYASVSAITTLSSAYLISFIF